MCEMYLRQAGEERCDLLVLPEHFDSFGSQEMICHDKGIYDETTDRSFLYRSVAEPIPGPMTKRLGAICRKYRIYCVACYTEWDGDKLYNTAVLLDRNGMVAGKYRKTHLCGSESRCNGITAGDDLPVFQTDFGVVGIAICMDMYYPEMFRILTLKGARIICWPHQTYGPSEEIILLQARCRALDNSCYLAGANFASPQYFAPYENGHALTGRATVINPDGVIIADTGHHEGLAIASFDPEPSRKTKDVVCIRKDGVDRYRDDILMLRRPELYGEIVRPQQEITAADVFINKKRRTENEKIVSTCLSDDSRP